MDNEPRDYKFMTNIIQHPRHRTRYVKGLKDFTIDAQVSYQRLFTALGIATLVVVAAVTMLRSNGDRLGYVAAPIILASLSVLVILVIYIMSSRNKSLLTSVMDLILFRFSEKARRSSSDRKTLSTLGIDSCENGIMRFDNGDVGIMYDVEGMISRSVLPAVASNTAEERRRYFVSRSPAVQEMLITSVRKADVRSNMSHMLDINKEATEAIDNGDESRQWDEYMSKVIYEYIGDNMAANDIQTFQSILIRDISPTELKKTRQRFEDSCRSGMYASATPVTDTGEIARRLGGIATMSADGLSQITGEDEHDRDNSRFSFDARQAVGEDENTDNTDDMGDMGDEDNEVDVFDNGVDLDTVANNEELEVAHNG